MLAAPAAVAGALGLVLATGGYSMVGFGIATACTDGPSAGGCGAMYRWMKAGVIGQWVLFLGVVVLVVAGLVLPGGRKAVVISIWADAALALAWFVFYTYGAAHAF